MVISPLINYSSRAYGCITVIGSDRPMIAYQSTHFPNFGITLLLFFFSSVKKQNTSCTHNLCWPDLQARVMISFLQTLEHWPASNLLSVTFVTGTINSSSKRNSNHYRKLLITYCIIEHSTVPPTLSSLRCLVWVREWCSRGYSACILSMMGRRAPGAA